MQTQLFEGDNEKAPKVGKYCGNRVPAPYTSQTNQLLILFKTDWSFNAEGFRIKYETGKFFST